MSKLDDAIRDALSEEDAELLARFEQEPPMLNQVFALARGPFAWVSGIFVAVAVIVGCLGVFAAWKFAVLEDVRAMMIWGAIAGFCLVVLAVIRLWFFMSLQTNRVIREIKRLELQVARLAAREAV